jgi:predicted nucleic acid-binding protein
MRILSISSILLDTSFILPTLGITVTGVTPEAIKFLTEVPKIEIYYSRFSVLESLWVATRISNAVSDAETVQLGLRSIIEGHRYKRVEEDSEIFKEAFRLYRLGHKDMIDNILYASGVSLGLMLLTLDDQLKKFILEKQLKDIFISPDRLAAALEKLQQAKGNHSN